MIAAVPDSDGIKVGKLPGNPRGREEVPVLRRH